MNNADHVVFLKAEPAIGSMEDQLSWLGERLLELGNGGGAAISPNVLSEGTLGISGEDLGLGQSICGMCESA